MANTENGKQRLLQLAGILLKETDEKHGLTRVELEGRLEKMGYPVERKALSRDIEILRDMINVENTGKPPRYYVERRDFELEEIMILIDAVESASFMTEKKKSNLIHKLKDLTSFYKAQELNAQIHYLGRHSSKNNDVLYSTSAIRTAINEKHPVTFQYYEYVLGAGAVPKRGGMKYILHPYTLVWDNGFYYCVGTRPEQSAQGEETKLYHFRVDRMKNVQVADDKELISPPEGFNVAKYIDSTFSMYGSDKEETVQLRFHKKLLNQFFDKFDQSINVMRDSKDPDFLIANVNIHVSPTFFSWVSQYAGEFTIEGPQKIRKQYHEHLRKALEA